MNHSVVQPSPVCFFREFVRAPVSIGAVAPSGPGPAKVSTAAVPRTGSPVVVELGPGTGAFTRFIQQRMPRSGRHIAVELNPRFAGRLAALHPTVDVVVADATELREGLDERGLGQADVVVSGLPWGAFRYKAQRDVLSEVVAVLHPDGAFLPNVEAAYRSSTSSVRRVPDQMIRRVVG